MKNQHNFVLSDNSQRGSMLVELVLSVALMSLIIPFVFKYQQDTISRAENIAVTKQMEKIQNALEKYISDNREKMLTAVGKNILRVKISDLYEYGITEDMIAKDSDKYQLRVIKSVDNKKQSTLQGVIIFASDDITPMRTREIVALGGYNMGFVDGINAYGPFGVWRADTAELGGGVSDGIISTTSINRDNSLYLWRVPTKNVSDSTMMSALNLGEHDIVNTNFLNLRSGIFDEFLKGEKIVTHNLIFQNRTTIDEPFETKSATVSGNMSSDSRGMDVLGRFYLTDLGKFSSFTTQDLWTNSLNLSGLSISSDITEAAVLKINQSLDITYGRINAIYTTVGFSGSVTPKLVIKSKIQDSLNPNYYWDVANAKAQFADLSLPILNQMSQEIVLMEKNSTTSYKIFSSVSKNSNATVGDFINALNEIENNVRSKYRLLNLE